jgi:hypothetical protein
MKKAIAVLSLCGSLLPALAHADELDDYTDKLLKVAPSKCLDEVSTITSNHFRRALPDLMLEGLRSALKFDAAWAPGNENYRQAHDLVEMGLQDEEARNGPIVNLTMQRYFRIAAGTWTPAERAEYLAFRKQKIGRLFWDSVLDGRMCLSFIQDVAKPPIALTEGPDKKRLDALATGATIRKAMLEMEYSLLPKDQRARFDKLGMALQKSIEKAYQASVETQPPRYTQVFQEVGPELKKIVQAYKQ